MKKSFPLTVILMIFSLSLLSACAPANSTIELSGSFWFLATYGPVDDQVDAVAGDITELKFGSDGSVSGNMGCNHFSGTYSQKGNTITFSPIAATEMACPEAQMKQESSAFQVIAGTVKFEVKEAVLIIYSADGKTKLVFYPIETEA